MVTHSRFVPANKSQRNAVLRTIRLRVELLEDRTLLSASVSIDYSSYLADPTAYDHSSIIVRFRPEAGNLTNASLFGGTWVNPEVTHLPGLRLVSLAPGVKVADALAAYNGSPLVQYAEPNVTVHLTDTTPNDPNYRLQYGYPKIHAPQAWDYTTGSSTIVVAGIDTGIDYTHEDLAENIWINNAEIPASRLQNLTDVDGDGVISFYDLQDPINQGPGKVMDLSGKGYIDATDILAPMDLDSNGNDLGTGGWAYPGNTQDGDTAHPNDFIGWNFVARNNRPLDDNGHGSHTAGTIGAIGNNGTGVTGVNWQVSLVPLKGLNAGGSGNIFDIVAAVDYCSYHQIPISNNSYGSQGGYLQAFSDAIANAGANANHLFVAAAGNNNSNNDARPFYPANYNLDNVISVAATDSGDNRASFSNYGATTVHLGAPGVNIFSTFKNNGYTSMSGTSMASPHVAGAAALLASFHPDWSFQQLKDQILNTVDPVASLSGRVITGGRLNVGAALSSAGPSGGGGSHGLLPTAVANFSTRHLKNDVRLADSPGFVSTGRIQTSLVPAPVAAATLGTLALSQDAAVLDQAFAVTQDDLVHVAVLNGSRTDPLDWTTGLLVDLAPVSDPLGNGTV